MEEEPSSGLPFPDPPSDTVLTISASSIISAPASFVFEILATPSTWPAWNTFCPEVEVTEQPPELQNASNKDTMLKGTKMTEQVRMNPEKPDSLQTQKVAVTGVEKPKPEQEDVAGSIFSVSWKAEGYPRLMLRTHRTNQCVVVKSKDGKSMCEFRTWEFMAGPLARTVKMLYGSTLKARFEDNARDLKNYAEKQYADSQGQ